MEKRNIGEVITMFLVEGYLDEDDIIPVLKKGTAKMMGEKEEKIFIQPLQKESELGERIKTQIEYLGEEGVNTPSFRRMVYEAVESIVVKEISNREKEIAEEVDKKKEKLPYTPRYCQSRNGIYYCGTCEQAWETCSCSARNTGYKRAIDEVLSILKH